MPKTHHYCTEGKPLSTPTKELSRSESIASRLAIVNWHEIDAELDNTEIRRLKLIILDLLGAIAVDNEQHAAHLAEKHGLLPLLFTDPPNVR